MKIFHKKKLELGKIIFVVDDFYFSGIKIKSAFRMVLINQPSSEEGRNYLQAKLSSKIIWNKYMVFGLVLFTLALFNVLSSLLFEFFAPTSLLSTGLNLAFFNLVLDTILSDFSIPQDDILKMCLREGFKTYKWFSVI